MGDREGIFLWALVKSSGGLIRGGSIILGPELFVSILGQSAHCLRAENKCCSQDEMDGYKHGLRGNGSRWGSFRGSLLPPGFEAGNLQLRDLRSKICKIQHKRKLEVVNHE